MITNRKNHLFLALCLLGSGAAAAVAQTAPTLEQRLAAVARSFGDAQGRILFEVGDARLNSTGEVRYASFSNGQQGFTIYTAGASVPRGNALAACTDPATTTSTCDPAYNEVFLSGFEGVTPDPVAGKWWPTVRCESDQGSPPFVECRFKWPNGDCKACIPGKCEPC